VQLLTLYTQHNIELDQDELLRCSTNALYQSIRHVLQGKHHTYSTKNQDILPEEIDLLHLFQYDEDY